LFVDFDRGTSRKRRATSATDRVKVQGWAEKTVRERRKGKIVRR
jgi:hypothetical protein